MKVSKSRIAVLVLIAVTIIYAVMLFQSVQAYNTWKEEQIQYHVEHYGGDRETGIGVPDFPLYFFSTHGQHYFVLSIGLSIIWFVYLTLKMSKFALAFIALCVTTILWGTAFHYTRLEYARALKALWIQSISHWSSNQL